MQMLQQNNQKKGKKKAAGGGKKRWKREGDHFEGDDFVTRTQELITTLQTPV